MVKIVDNSHEVICELLECILNYSEMLQNPRYPREISEDQRYPEVQHFVIRSDEDRLQAVIKMIFGEYEEARKAGNPSFLEHDKRLMAELRREALKTGKTREELIDKYIPRAQKRFRKTESESVRERLIDAYQQLPTEMDHREIPDYGDDIGKGFEQSIAEEEIDAVLRPWLQKYRRELINLLTKS